MDFDLAMMKKLLLALALTLASSAAWAQCNGVFPAGSVCGNNTGASRTPFPFALGGTSGSVLGPTTTISGDAATWSGTTGGTLYDTPGASLLVNPISPTTSGITQTLGTRVNEHGISIKAFGAIGDGSSHPLSTLYSSLAVAQKVYPFVNDLTQEVDWAATQAAINYATTNGFQNVYCPNVTGANASYRLSNPVWIDNPNNTRSGFAAWASGTTYAQNATVIYNGVTWQSLGAGNIGNAPTSATGYPANISIVGAKLPYATVSITNGSPSIGVVPSTAHGLTAGRPVIFLPQTYTTPAIPSPALPTGLSPNTVYYVIATGLTSNTFEVSAMPGGSAITPSSAGSGVFTVTTQVWQPYITGGPTFSDRTNFIGDEGQPSGEGCRFLAMSLTSPGLIVGPNNGNLIKNISILGGNPNIGFDAGAQNTYRCSSPTNLIGIGNIADGGGTSRTYYENVGTDGFHVGWESTIGGGGTLGDSNTFFKPQFNDSCLGMSVNSQENFINTVYDGEFNGNNVSVDSTLGAGVNIIGGNPSTVTGVWNILALSSVTTSSAANNFYVSAIVSATTGSTDLTPGNLDFYLNMPLCGYNLQCVYQTFNMVTSHYGVIPLTVIGFNPNNQQITLQVNSTNAPYANTGFGDLTTDLSAVTSLYMSEVGTIFNGEGVLAKDVHIENDGPPTTLMATTFRFGSARPSKLEDIFNNSGITNGVNVCCSQTPNAQQLAQFYGAQTTPYINASLDLVLNNISSGSDAFSADRVLIEGTGFIQWSHVQPWLNPAQSHPGGNQSGSLYFTGNSGGALGYNFQINPSSCTFGSQLSCGYNQNFTAAFGQGQYDNPGMWLSGTAGAADGQRYATNQAPTWGVRPAPYSSPCITPAQVAAVTSNAAMTWTSNLRFINVVSGGSGYQQGDVVTLVGGTATVSATVTVATVNGSGAITSLNFGTTAGGSYTAEASTFTATGGHGTSATFGTPSWFVNYVQAYPLLWGGTIYHVCDYQGTTQTKYGVQSNNLGYSYFQNLTPVNVPNLAWSAHSGSPIVYLNQEALQLTFPGNVLTLSPQAGSGCGVASFTGSISGTTLTTSLATGTAIASGQTVVDTTGNIKWTTVITSGSGSSWIVSPSQTVSPAELMTAANANSAIVTGVYPDLGYVTTINVGQDGTPYILSLGAPGTNCTGTTIAQAAPNIVNPY